MKDLKDSINIVIFPDNYNPKEKGIRLTYCYLHGKAEKDAGYDCFNAIWDNCPSDKEFVNKNAFPDGIYPCKIDIGENQVDALFFYWHDNVGENHHHGLVTYTDDQEAIDHAKERYNKKSPHI